MAQRITDELGGRGVYAVELFVRGDDVWFSDVSPRPPDTGLVTMCTQMQSAFELHARAILRLPVDVSLRAPGASAVDYGRPWGGGLNPQGAGAALPRPKSVPRAVPET